MLSELYCTSVVAMKMCPSDLLVVWRAITWLAQLLPTESTPALYTASHRLLLPNNWGLGLLLTQAHSYKMQDCSNRPFWFLKSLHLVPPQDLDLPHGLKALPTFSSFPLSPSQVFPPINSMHIEFCLGVCLLEDLHAHSILLQFAVFTQHYIFVIYSYGYIYL